MTPSQDNRADLQAGVVSPELAVLSQPCASTDVPAGFSAVAAPLRDNDRALLTICAKIYSEESMDAVRQILESDPNPELDEAFRDLPEDADDTTRQALAERLAPIVRRPGADRTVKLVPKTTTPHQIAAARSTFEHALEALYYRTQLDVLRRARQIVTGHERNTGAQVRGRRLGESPRQKHEGDRSHDRTLERPPSRQAREAGRRAAAGTVPLVADDTAVGAVDHPAR
ncbi:hypothetical protein [Promicromonospora sp. NPDC090134]|uniref:hypothetical protein n=1 Tax=Promicromonospora sp. NPDC090134 TaxID=3364408 RepID=UPI00380B6054